MHTPDYTEIGNRIAQIRRSHNMAQEKLAELLDVTPKHISQVENATSSFSLKHLIHFCELNNCSFDYIIFGKEGNDALAKLPDEIVEILQGDNKNEQDRLARYLQIFVELLK